MTSGNGGWGNGGFIPGTETQFYLIKYEQCVPYNTTFFVLYSIVPYLGTSESSSDILITTVQKQKYILQHAVSFVSEISLIYDYLLQ